MNTLSIKCLLTTVYTINKKAIMILYILHYRSKTSFILRRTGGFYHFIKEDFFC